LGDRQTAEGRQNAPGGPPEKNDLPCVLTREILFLFPARSSDCLSVHLTSAFQVRTGPRLPKRLFTFFFHEDVRLSSEKPPRLNVVRAGTEYREK
jgi:hypothetical protein